MSQLKDKYNVSKDSDWRWVTTSPGAQTVSPCQRWEFRLPIQFSGRPPRCRWRSELLKDGKYTISDDTLSISIDIPAQAKNVYKVYYQLDGSPPLEGFVFLKVFPPNSSEMNSVNPYGETEENVKTNPTPSPQKIVEPTLPSPSEIKPKEPPPLPAGEYFVSVYRENIAIPQLKKRIETHKSLTVGKFSMSKNIWPDIDLKPHFKSKDISRRCSRRQAKIYWQDGRIIIKNLGKFHLDLSEGRYLETDDIHYWQSGEGIEIPGGLTLFLEKEG